MTTSQKSRADAARQWPAQTCAASRHAQRIGEALLRGVPHTVQTQDMTVCGESILSTVASLWEARSLIVTLWEQIEHRDRIGDELRARIAQAEADAARYQWLRDVGDADAAIDAARGETNK